MTRFFRLAIILAIVMVTSVTAQSTAAAAPQLAGWWEGTLHAGASLRLQLHVVRSGNGWKGTFTSLDQRNAKFPATSIALQGRQVTIAASEADAKFQATLSHDALTGTWSQGGGSLPLTLNRKPGPITTDVTLLQRPKPPFPYRSVDVTVTSFDGVKLAGTLTLPDGKGPFPAAILIAGSGPHGRDEDVLGHKIFWVIADALSRHGLAVLRMDKRGIGKSGGDYATATTLDFAHDTASTLAFLGNYPGIDAHEIGLIGHSEGGLIAPIVAAKHPPQVAFVVMLAGPALPGSAIIVDQVVAEMNGAGASAAEQAQVRRVETRFVDTVEDAPDAGAVPAALRKAVAQGELPQKTLRGIGPASSPWYYEFLKLNPAPYLQKLRCPVLALDGSKDTQVPAAVNVPALRKALANDPHATVVELPGLNHLFQPAKTGLSSEYASSPITFSPVALNRIEHWLAGVVGSKP